VSVTAILGVLSTAMGLAKEIFKLLADPVRRSKKRLTYYRKLQKLIQEINREKDYEKKQDLIDDYIDLVRSR